MSSLYEDVSKIRIKKQFEKALQTLLSEKPMTGHELLEAISRKKREFALEAKEVSTIQGVLIFYNTDYEETGLQDVQVHVRLGYTRAGMRSLKLVCMGWDAMREHTLLQGEYASDESPKGLASLVHQAHRNWQAQ